MEHIPPPNKLLQAVEKLAQYIRYPLSPRRLGKISLQPLSNQEGSHQTEKNQTDKKIVREGTLLPRPPSPPAPDAKEKLTDRIARISSQEYDLFKMKALSLIQKHLQMPPVHTLEQIHNTPIAITALSEQNVVTLEQTLTSLGEKVILRGSFKRGEKNSLPVKGSFQLIRASQENSLSFFFQFGGWALCEVLLPPSPKQISSLATLPPFQQRIPVAQPLASKQLFSEHRQLIDALIHYSPLSIPDAEKIGINWLGSVEKSQDPLTRLTETWGQLYTLFVRNPCQALKTAWEQKTAPALRDPDPTVAYTEALVFLTRTRLDQEQYVPSEQREFYEMMGKILGTASTHIVLQYFSKKLGAAPPTLDHFEKCIQSAVIRQWEVHLSCQYEMFSPTQNFISLLEQRENYHPAVQELQVYYADQFASKAALY